MFSMHKDRSADRFVTIGAQEGQFFAPDLRSAAARRLADPVVIVLMRKTVRPFTDQPDRGQYIRRSGGDRNRERPLVCMKCRPARVQLAASLEDLRTTQDRLVQTQKLAFLGELTVGACA